MKDKKEMKKRGDNTLIIVLALGMGLFIILAGISSILYSKQKIENQQLTEGFGGLMMYMVNVTKYCADSNNMTYEELLKEHLQSEIEKVLEDFGGDEE